MKIRWFLLYITSAATEFPLESEWCWKAAPLLLVCPRMYLYWALSQREGLSFLWLLSYFVSSFFFLRRFVTDHLNAFCIWVLILDLFYECSEEDLPSKLQLFKTLNNEKYLLAYCFSPEVMWSDMIVAVCNTMFI